jgi:hypothetical protein
MGVVGTSIFVLLVASVCVSQQMSATFSLAPDVDLYVPSFLRPQNALLSLSVCSLFLVPVVLLEMHWHQDRSGITWYERYKDTPGVFVFQAVATICFMGFVIHVLSLLGLRLCDLCDGPFGVFFSSEAMKLLFIVAYWSHIAPSAFICILAPLQFLEPVRKFQNFFVHRWAGRVILVCAVLHQSGASLMLLVEFKSSRADGSDAGTVPFYSHLAVSAAFNLYAWVSLIVGWNAVLRKSPDIPLHGAMMHRLGGSWFAIICTFRVVALPLVPILGDAWGLSMGSWVAFFGTIIPLEAYLKYSGRFDPAVPDSKKCPFLAQHGV